MNVHAYFSRCFALLLQIFLLSRKKARFRVNCSIKIKPKKQCVFFYFFRGLAHTKQMIFGALIAQVNDIRCLMHKIFFLGVGEKKISLDKI